MLSARERIGHLFRRAGFGATPAEIDHWTSLGLAKAVDALITAPTLPEAIAPPDWKQPYDATHLADIQAYWLSRMATTRFPLVEQMTLFWHGHFATGVSKAKVELMQRQNQLFRQHALGSFPALLRAIGTDAAMLHWLDGNHSQKRSPNENYSRESMELFTTGPGAYTEADVKQSARALTGWRVDKDTGEVSFNPSAWDAGEKSFLGHTGKFKADDIADILSGRPETTTFLATKLWRFFAAPAPDPKTVSAMAGAYVQSGGQIAPMLRLLFLADSFYADTVVGALVRSPADFIASTVRLVGLPVSRDMAHLCDKMGQVLFNPPNVAGWPGGPVWLGASTMLARMNFGEMIKQWLGQKSRAPLMLPAKSPVELVDQCLDLFGIVLPTETTRAALLKLVGTPLPTSEKDRWELMRNLMRTVIAAPEYQIS